MPEQIIPEIDGVAADFLLVSHFYCIQMLFKLLTISWFVFSRNSLLSEPTSASLLRKLWNIHISKLVPTSFQPLPQETILSYYYRLFTWYQFPLTYLRGLYANPFIVIVVAWQFWFNNWSWINVLMLVSKLSHGKFPSYSIPVQVTVLLGVRCFPTGLFH